VLSFLGGAAHIHLLQMDLPVHGAHHAGSGGATRAEGARTFPAQRFFGDGFSSVVWRNRLSAGAAFPDGGDRQFLLATAAGLSAGWLVFRFMAKLADSTDAPMRSEDYRIEGSLGTISMTIRENGTGEIIFFSRWSPAVRRGTQR